MFPSSTQPRLDIAATRRAVESDLLYRLRNDGNPAPSAGPF